MNIRIDSFRERAAHVLAEAADGNINDGNDHRRRIFVNLARLGVGRVAEALADIVLLQQNEPKDDCMFFRHGNIDAFLRFRPLFPDDLAEAVRKRLTLPRYRIGHGQTENHKIMIAAAGILVGETWPDDAHTAEDADHCRQYMRDYFDRITRFGQGEFDSPAYATFYLTSLLTLRDTTHDMILRAECERMLEWYLKQSAVEWLDGDMCGGHSRDYHAFNGPERPSVAHSALWLYFGGRTPGSSHSSAHFAAICALSDYRPPEPVLQAARGDHRPGLVRKSHDMVANDQGQTQDDFKTRPLPGNPSVRGWGYVSKVGVRKTAWMDRAFALGSFMDGVEGDVTWTGQARRWSLDWISDLPCPVFFCTHPFPDTHHPENAEKDKAKWLGSSPFEQVVQHKTTLLAVYRIPESGTYQYAPRQPFPAGVDPWIDGFHSAHAILRWRNEGENCLICHGGSVVFAVTTSAPIRWVVEPDAASGRDGRWRCEGRTHAVAVEAAPASGDPTRIDAELDAFARLLTEKAHFSPTVDNGVPALTYTNTAVDTVAIEYNGSRRINDVVLDPFDWPLFEAPDVI